MRRLTLAAALCVGPSALAAQSGVADAIGSITPEDYIRRVGVIAHDSMRGRDTPSRGLDLTAQWIADEFRAMGLRPGSGDSFIQRYTIRRTRFDQASSGVSIWGGETLRFGTDAVRLRGGATDRDGVSGPTVVVSGNPARPEAFLELDVRGAVVVAVVNASNLTLMSRSLRRRRPAAVILVSDRSDRAWRSALDPQPATALARGWGGGGGGGGGRTRTPVIEIRDESIAAALSANGYDLARARRSHGPLEAQPLSGLNFTVTLNFDTVGEVTAPNVVGILEGSDRLLREEYLLYSAHMDHVGVGRPAGRDSIYNGADDNASGTIAVVEAAEAFATLRPRPRRSIIFLLVSGEEKGLWGSEYFATNPAVSIDRIVANLNADMVGRNWPDSIVAIGKEHSDLGETLERVNARHPELDMTAIDDLWPAQSFYTRSDHYNFARRGVPILFFFNGTHEDYHQPGDEVHKVNADKAARITKLLFYLGLEIANRDRRPRWYPDSYRAIVTKGGQAVRRSGGQAGRRAGGQAGRRAGGQAER